jgi:hypothetical protein
MNINYLTLTQEIVKKSIFSSKTVLAFLFILFGIQINFGQSPYTDNTPGGVTSFTVPAGVTSVTISLWGAGGAGGGSTSNNSGGSGGGSGGYATRTFTGLTAGQVINYTTGTGGTGSTGNGTNGTLSTLTFSGFTLTGNGGTGGQSNQGTIGTGGTATGGTTNTTGGNGLIGTNVGGDGGNAPAGGGTGGAGNINANGGNGIAPGGGGGGGERGGGNRNGGDGGNGGITITFTCPTFSAGANQTLATCATTTTLAATAATAPATGAWTVVSGSGTVTTPTSATSGVTGIVPGTPLVLRWTITNGSCGSSNNTVTITSPSGPGCLSYCAPTYASGPGTIDGITNVTLLTLNNNSGANNVSPYYTFFNAVTVPNLIRSTTPNISISYGTDGNQWGAVWLDFNQNGIFEATEGFVSTVNAGASGTSVITITVPPGAVLGNTRMRVRGGNDSILTTAQACGASSSGFGETEDYIVNIIDLLPCVAPTTQPTALVLTPAGGLINGTFTAAIPAPNNYLVVMNTTGVAPTPVNGTTYTIGSTILGGTNVIIDTDTNTNFSATSLAANTTYYFFIYSFNSACSGGPLYRTVSPLTGNATTPLTYCTVTAQNVGFNDGITRVQFNTINNITSANAGNEYNDYTAINTTVTQGQFHNLSVYVNTDGAFTQYQRAWFDWNRDGDFNDPGEAYDLGTATNVVNGISSLCPLSVLIPVTSVTGAIRMRVSSRYNAYANPCDTGYDGEIEDYTVIINAAPACTAPTTQPTALILTPGTPSGTAINGNFVAAIPAVQSYLVVMNTTNIAPTIVNGTTYTIGGSIGVGNTVVDTDTNTTFTATGLNNSTTYYFFVYSMNNLCTGGPLYRLVSPLTGNATTTATNPTYCTPVTVNPNNTSRYISRVAFIGTLNDTNNISTFSAATPGYQDFTGLAAKAIQAQGEGVNLIVESIGGRGRLIAWIDWNKDGVYAPTEIVYGPPAAGISSTFGFIIPSGTVPGNYRIRVRTFNSFYNDGNPGNGNPDEYFGYNFNACETFNTGTIGGFPTTQYGEAEDYLFTVIQRCDANIVSVTDGQVCNSGTVSLSATGTAGTTQYRWYANATGGAQLAGSPTVGSWTTPSISTTTTYYVTAFNGSCESLVRKPVVANVNPIPTLTFNPAAPEVCGENSIVALTAGGDKQMTDLLYERFEGGLGAFTNINSDATAAPIKADSRWTQRASTFIPTAGQAWKPAISSGLAPNHYALATSDTGTPAYELIQNSLESGVLNSTNYLNLTMTMKFYYSRYYPDNTNNADEYVRIQISQNGGAWNTLPAGDFTADTGIGTAFANLSFNLNAYINQTNIRVRLLHRSLGSVSGWLPDGVAVDDIRIFGEVPLNTAFNWTGGSLPDAFQDFACTIPYVSGTPIVTVYVRPTLAQLASGSYTFNATALLSNGCTASQPITITNKSKLYVGAGSDWNTAANWNPVGVPTANDCVVITDGRTALINPAGYQAFAKNTTVKGSGILNMNPNTFLTNTEWVNVVAGGVFNMENSASLIQINNVANTGVISMKRNAVTDSALDYVYWSTPVAGFSLNNVTPSSTIRYRWEPTVARAYPSNFGNWIAASGAMTTGRGYIIRGSSGISTFTGNPNNGNITTPITRGTYTGANYAGPTATPVTLNDDNLNLIGNPYPSAISADAFLAANSTNLAQWVKIWTHGLDPAAIVSPFYQNFQLNYNINDYLQYNALGGTQFGYDGRIGAGQGFFVLMTDAATTSENAVFNNSMRSNTHRNDQFYRTSGENNHNLSIEKHRIWLNLIAPNSSNSDVLVGYATEATNDIDDKFDAPSQDVKTDFEMYSIVDNKGFQIQGRSLPFDENDRVQLGVKIPQNGIYTIAINAVDGIFSNTTQNIYLEDVQLGVIHDIRTAPYLFTGTVGKDESRFVLRYTNNNVLSQETFDTENSLRVVTNENATVYSTVEKMNSIEVYDLLGKKIKSYSNIDANEFKLYNLTKNNAAIVLKIKLNNGTMISKKVIF